MEIHTKTIFVLSEIWLSQNLLQLCTNQTINRMELIVRPMNRIARVDLDPDDYPFKTRKQPQRPTYAGHTNAIYGRVRFEGDVAYIATDSRPAKCLEKPDIRKVLDHEGGSPNVTHVGANIEVANSVHDALAGQRTVDAVGKSEVHAIDSLFLYQTTALDVYGFRGSKKLGMAGREEVRVDHIADFSRQLEKEWSESSLRIDR